MQDNTKYKAIEAGVFVLENLGEQYSLRKPVYVPNSSVTLFKSVTREVRERSEPEKYEPKWDEPNPTRVAASINMWRRLKYPSGVARGNGRLARQVWPKGFRELVFDSRCSADGATRCFCCGRSLGVSKDACLRFNLQQHDPADYIDMMELSHVEAHCFGGPDIYVNVWPGCGVCNGLMRANRFTDFAQGQWTPGQEPKNGSSHPVQVLNFLTHFLDTFS